MVETEHQSLEVEQDRSLRSSIRRGDVSVVVGSLNPFDVQSADADTVC